jgi:hypothetical protein
VIAEETYSSPLHRDEVLRILREEVDSPPTGFRMLITLNAARYVGTSPVCGWVAGGVFELRNRRDPFLSLRAKGRVVESDSGSTLTITWQKPRMPDPIGGLLFRRYSYDREKIVEFLIRWLKIASGPA